jgi:hypothetical protein
MSRAELDNEIEHVNAVINEISDQSMIAHGGVDEEEYKQKRREKIK